MLQENRRGGRPVKKNIRFLFEKPEKWKNRTSNACPRYHLLVLGIIPRVFQTPSFISSNLESLFMSWVRVGRRFGSPDSSYCHSCRGLLRGLWLDSLGQVSQALRC